MLALTPSAAVPTCWTRRCLSSEAAFFVKVTKVMLCGIHLQHMQLAGGLTTPVPCWTPESEWRPPVYTENTLSVQHPVNTKVHGGTCWSSICCTLPTSMVVLPVPAPTCIGMFGSSMPTTSAALQQRLPPAHCEVQDPRLLQGASSPGVSWLSWDRKFTCHYRKGSVDSCLGGRPLLPQ